MVFRQRDELRAQLLARSGLRLALLQLRAAKKGKEKAKSMGLGENSSVVEQIWRTPLMFPPPDIPGLPPSDSAALAEFRKSLGLEGSVTINIQGESGKYGINQLVWPSYGNSSDIMGVSSGGDRFDPSVLTGGGSPSPNPTQQYGTNQSAEEQRKEAQRKVKESFVQIFQNILEQKRQDDDTFREKYPSLNGEQIVGNILAWMDPFTSQDGDQRDKNDYYEIGRAHV